MDFSIRAQLPAVFPFREFTELGGLISYGPSLPDTFRMAANYVDSILKGAKPADLPIEQPTKISVRDQPQDRERARPDRAADPARSRRRGDRMIGREVAYWHLGDVGASVNGRFAPKAAIPVKSAFDPKRSCGVDPPACTRHQFLIAASRSGR